MTSTNADATPATPHVPNVRAGYPLMKGWIFGFLAMFPVLALFKNLIYEIPKEWDWINLILALGIGTTIGTSIQLWIQKRNSEIRPFVRGQLLGLALVIPWFILAMIGRHYYGEIGWWITLVGVAVLFMLVGWIVQKFRQSKHSSFAHSSHGDHP